MVCVHVYTILRQFCTKFRRMVFATSVYIFRRVHGVRRTCLLAWSQHNRLSFLVLGNQRTVVRELVWWALRFCGTPWRTWSNSPPNDVARQLEESRKHGTLLLTGIVVAALVLLAIVLMVLP